MLFLTGMALTGSSSCYNKPSETARASKLTDTNSLAYPKRNEGVETGEQGNACMASQMNPGDDQGGGGITFAKVLNMCNRNE